MRIALSGSACAAIWLLAAPAMATTCDDLPADRSTVGAESRTMTPEDLLGLRDIGAAWTTAPETPVFDLSPDGQRVVFELHRADAATNSYCSAIIEVSLKPGAAPLILASGLGQRLATVSSFGFAVQIPSGLPATASPKWSPDGQWVAFLKSTDGLTQLWRVRADGMGAEAVTHEAFDIEDFRWSEDGGALLFAGRPALRKSQEAIDVEALSGYHYDDRFIPGDGSRPLVREPIETKTFSLDLKTGNKTPIAAFPEPQTQDGKAWLVSADAKDVTALSRLHAILPGKAEVVCDRPECLGVRDYKWLPGHQSIVYLRREGWGDSQTGVYVWGPGQGPRRVLSTDDVLMGCQPTTDALICAYETSVQPREIVHVDLDTGQITPLFDPNPEIKMLRLGSVRRLHWTNAFGLDTFGDLVLPPDHTPGEVHPLVVVQYQSRGFLRGGTGNEFPIQALAAHGFAVLSVERPPTIGTLKKPSSWEEVNRLNAADWADYRSVQSSLEIGVSQVVALGVADPRRVGLTGLSNGSSVAQFTLLHSHVFSIAAVGTCCDEPYVTTVLDGPAFTAQMHRYGYPSLLEDGKAFWAKVSIPMNAAGFNTPLLMQLPEHEYLGALESYTALKLSGKPVDMYVFPDDYHVLFQPAHRLAAYHRVVDWFDFWFNDRLDPARENTEQYQVWQGLRASAAKTLSASPGP